MLEPKTDRQAIMGIVIRAKAASRGEEPSRAILQCNYLSPTISLSFPQVSSFATLRCFKFQRTMRKEWSFYSLSEYLLDDLIVRIARLAAKINKFVST